MHPTCTKLFLMWYVNTSVKKVSGFNDVLLRIYKGFKCVAQFVSLFQISRENKQN